MEQTLDDQKREPKERLLAVIIGIGGYRDHPLLGAANDAMLLAETLKQAWRADRCDITALVWPHFADGAGPGKPIDPLQTRGVYTRVWGSDPPASASHVTRDAILETVRRKAELANPDDTFLIYFAGHGNVSNSEACLLTIDDGLTDSGLSPLPISEICETVNSVKCATPNRVMFLDCCLELDELAGEPDAEEIMADFMGENETVPNGIEKDRTAEFMDVLHNVVGDDWYVLFSCSPGQKSYEDVVYDKTTGNTRSEGRHQGLFTLALVQGLKGQAGASIGEPIGLLQLANYVHQRVPMEQRALTGKGEKKREEEKEEKEDDSRSTRALLVDRWIESRGLPSRAGGDAGLDEQHPVLLARKGIVGSYFNITLAPNAIRRKTDIRRQSPSPGFKRYFSDYLFGPWPVKFTRRRMLREGGAFLYGMILMLTALWFAPSDNASAWVSAIGWGIAGALLWWLFVPFAVAANEDCWHSGGYVTAIAFVVLHVALWVMLAWRGLPLDSDVWKPGVALCVSGAELFFFLSAVIIFGCNAVQGIICLADNIRDEPARRSMTEALRVFRQFRMGHLMNVDVSNLIATVTACPKVYFMALGLFIAILAGDTLFYLLSFSGEQRLWIALLRNAFGLVFLLWLVYWFDAAFQFLERDISKT